MDHDKSIFILSFITRYWKLHVLLVLFVILNKIDQVVYFVGPTFYLFMLAVAVCEVVFLVKNIAFKQTLDAFTENDPTNPDGVSDFVMAWTELTAEQKLKWTIISLLVLFPCFAIIAASIAK